jgi:CDP-glucose 4,6-dehydratase
MLAMLRGKLGKDIMINSDFWAGKRVFITGHTGFKGAWLSLWLQDRGAFAKGYSLAPNTEPSLFSAAEVGSGMESVIGDIRDLDCLTENISQFNPEIVIHMAAQPLVKRSYDNPVETYSTNVMGTVNLFEAVRAASSVKAVVNVTTDKCYENREWVWGYRENEPMGGFDPYSNSKGCAELVTSCYRNSFFNGPDTASIATARAGNVVGGGDWAADRLIPDIIKSLQTKAPVLVRNPLATRPWQHVLEPLSGYLCLAEKLYMNGDEYAGGWNFGPLDADVRPVGDVVEYLTKAWGDGAEWKCDDLEHAHEAQLLKLDISKAQSRLNWRPRWRLKSTLDSIVTWHKSMLAGKCAKELCLEEIRKFEQTN